VNLDYRKGKIEFPDLNGEQNYDASQAFNRSQLANMLVLREMAESWKKDNILMYGVYPGVCSTNIKRHMGVDKSITGNIIANPLLWILTKSAERGAQTALHVATDPSLSEPSGTLFSNMKPLEVDPVADDKVLASKMVAVSSYWSGLVDKADLVKQAPAR
jgi:retinol dehydrogenase-14